jgi:lycopene cyclase domain-containing protein
MNPHYYYMLVNLSCVLVPFLFSFHPRLKFYIHWKAFATGALCMCALFIPWDFFFTHKGIWGFNDEYTIGYKIVNLPIEEWLFFMCIPYACCFTYHCLRLLIKTPPALALGKPLAVIFALAALVIAFTHLVQWYTLAAHFLCAAFLLLHVFVFKSNYLHWFFLMYFIILVPFLASNGVLTGITFWQYAFFNFDVDAISEKIVWYNNDHNLRFRLFSMPADDLAYGMLMLLLTITGYEWQLAKNNKSAKAMQ